MHVNFCGGKTTSEDLMRGVANEICKGNFVEGKNFDKQIKIRRFIDSETLSEFPELAKAHVDMYAIVKVKDSEGKTRIIHLIIEYDGKQHDISDRDGAMRAFLGIIGKKSKEIDDILADIDSPIYLKYYIAWRNSIKTDQPKNELFASLKDKGFHLIRIPGYEVKFNDRPGYLMDQLVKQGIFISSDYNSHSTL